MIDFLLINGSELETRDISELYERFTGVLSEINNNYNTADTNDTLNNRELNPKRVPVWKKKIPA
jgi:hypothetical protein